MSDLVFYVRPDQADQWRNDARFIPKHAYVRRPMLAGEIGSVAGMRLVIDSDPALRDQQRVIQEKIQQSSPDEVQTLQAQCAIIGHVASVIKGPEREVCFYCGVKI